MPGFGWPPATRTQVAAMSEVGKPQGHLTHWVWVDLADAAGLAVWKSCLELLLPVWKKEKIGTPVSCGTTVSF